MLTRSLTDFCSCKIGIPSFPGHNNHYHIVLYLDPLASEKWSDDEVAERWLEVFPSRLDKPENATQREMKKLAIMDNPDLLEIYRQRLGDLSWFMRRLNEPLAKLSNREDFCTGRLYECLPWHSPFGPSSFLRCSNIVPTYLWEGRYSSQALLDEAAVLSCMAYVDLNPVRAKITQKLEESTHTSIKHRLDTINLKSKSEQLEQSIEAVAGSIQSNKLSITLREYAELTEWAGKSIVHPGKASIPAHLQPVLERLNLQQSHWLKQIEYYGQFYCRVVGPVALIRQKAKELKLRCLHGINAASQMYLSPQ